MKNLKHYLEFIPKAIFIFLLVVLISFLPCFLSIRLSFSLNQEISTENHGKLPMKLCHSNSMRDSKHKTKVQTDLMKSLLNRKFIHSEKAVITDSLVKQVSSQTSQLPAF